MGNDNGYPPLRMLALAANAALVPPGRAMT